MRALLMAAIIALAGCADEAPAPDDVVVETTGEGDPLSGLDLDAAAEPSTGHPTPFLFVADIEDPKATWTATVVREGEESTAAEGTGLPGGFSLDFQEPGIHHVTVEVAASGHARTKVTIKVDVVLGDASEQLPRGAQEPIRITNTVTGVPEADLGNLEEFELSLVPEKMTLTFSQGPTAVDLDFYVFDADGQQVGRAAGFEPLGEGMEPPIEITGERLESLGSWSIEVVGYTAVEGEYTIDITFE